MNITKKIIALCIIALVAVATTVYAIAQTTFTINNTIPQNLGTVTLIDVNSQDYNVSVTGVGNFNADVSAAVNEVVINGQHIIRPYSGPATLNSGTQAAVNWSTNMIEIIDPSLGLKTR